MIGDWAFEDCSSLTSITLPDSITTISDSAFYGCTGLTSITIPNNVTVIGDWAFGDCTGLTSIIIPNNVTSIGNSAFSGCSGLTSITIPDNVTSIGDDAFSYCSGLTSVKIGNRVTSIGDSAFWGCYKLVEVINKSKLNITKGSDSNGYVAYYALSVKTEGASDIVNVDDYLFYTYNNVNYLLGYVGNDTELVFPDNYNEQNYEIYEDAFYDCSKLTSITIPDSVTSISKGALSGCSNVDAITVSKNNQKYKSIGNCLIEIDSKTIILGCKNSVIPNDDSVTTIGAGAFGDCTGLTSIIIPNNVTSIGNSAFTGCTGLTSIIIPNSVTSIDNYAFYGCTGLTNVTLGSNVKRIGSYAFAHCSNLVSITIPDGVTSLDDGQFYNCKSLKYLTIGSGLQLLTPNGFVYCNNLESITVSTDNTTYKSVSNCLIEIKTKKLVFGCKNSVIPDDDSVTSIGDYAFFNCIGLQSITIPKNLISIGHYAFAYCYNLENIIIASENTTFKYINNCLIDIQTKTLIYGLKDSVIPDDGSVTSIGCGAYLGCNLRSITIPKCITSIDNQAFAYCFYLTKIQFQGTIEEWEKIEKASNWDDSSISYVIRCTDELIIPSD